MSRQEIKLYIQEGYLGFTIESRQALYDKFIGDADPNVKFANGRLSPLTRGFTEQPGPDILKTVLNYFSVGDFKVFNVDYHKGTAEIEWFGTPIVDANLFHLCTGSLTNSFGGTEVGTQLLGFYLETAGMVVHERETVTPEQCLRDGAKLTITHNGASRDYELIVGKDPRFLACNGPLILGEVWHFGTLGLIAMRNLVTDSVEIFQPAGGKTICT